MKWTLAQLRKNQNFPLQFSETCDFKKEAERVLDIVDILPVVVKGKIFRINDDTFRIQYHIDAPLILQCALTLEPVDYLMAEDYDEIFSIHPDDESYLIEKNTIDLYEVVWSNIVIEKPLNVTLPNAYDILAKRGVVLLDDDFDEDYDSTFGEESTKDE